VKTTILPGLTFIHVLVGLNPIKIVGKGLEEIVEKIEAQWSYNGGSASAAG
jgi:hypothetical protein